MNNGKLHHANSTGLGSQTRSLTFSCPTSLTRERKTEFKENKAAEQMATSILNLSLEHREEGEGVTAACASFKLVRVKKKKKPEPTRAMEYANKESQK